VGSTAERHLSFSGPGLQLMSMDRLFSFPVLMVVSLLLLTLAAISAIGFGSPWGYLLLLAAMLLNLVGAMSRSGIISKSRSRL